MQNLKTFGRYAADQTRQAHQAVPVLQFLCDKLGEGLATRHPFAVQFCLESLLALLSHLPDQVRRQAAAKKKKENPVKKKLKNLTYKNLFYL